MKKYSDYLGNPSSIPGPYGTESYRAVPDAASDWWPIYTWQVSGSRRCVPAGGTLALPEAGDDL